MSKLISITQASELTGLSVTTIRRRIASGSLPYTRANAQQGKLLFDAELLQQVLRQEVYNNLRGCSMEDDVQEQAQPTSYLASLFKPSDDPVQAQAEQDARFGYQPRNTNASASFTF